MRSSEGRFPALTLAVRNLSRQRLRAALAALGIVIGVFAVVTLGLLGNALGLAATAELGSLGNQVIVSPADAVESETLEGRDLAAIRRAADGRGALVPIKVSGGTVSGTDGQAVTQVYGARNPRALFGGGGGSVPTYHRQGALVGAGIAGDLGLQRGSTITVERNEYRVMGLLPDVETISPLQPGSAVVLPPGEFATSGFSQVVVAANSGADAAALASELERRLNDREQRVSVFSLRSVVAQISEFFGLLNGFLLAIASISLIVACVSIFNVMLMTVSERRGEIGVLRAVGIHRSQVLRVLLIEASLLGVVGGLVGAVLGTVTVVVTATQTDLPLWAVFVPGNLVVPLGAFGFGVLVALVGGVYPAYRAAWEPPVEALRG